MKIAGFIETRRKSRGITLDDLAKTMSLTPNTYRKRLKKDGFTEAELLAAAGVLKFDVILLPQEADIFTA